MPGWRGSDRSSRLPPNWPLIRRRILKRDGYRCQVRNAYGVRCLAPATEVDHIIPGDDHRDENLQAICSYHHGKKSGREGAKALAAKRRQHAQRFRRQEVHPGLLR